MIEVNIDISLTGVAQWVYGCVREIMTSCPHYHIGRMPQYFHTCIQFIPECVGVSVYAFPESSLKECEQFQPQCHS